MTRPPASTREGVALWQQAQQLVSRGMGDDALAVAERLCELEPANTNAHLMAAAVAHTQGRLRQASGHALAASRTDIADAAILANVVMALLRTGEVARARECTRHPLVSQALPGPLLLRFAGALQAMECHADALLLIDRAIAGGTDNAAVRFQRSIELMFNGRKDDVEGEIERSLSMGLTAGRATLMLSRQRRQTAGRNHVERIRESIRRVPPGSEDNAALEFALYKEHEDLGQDGEAWNALERGNRIMAAMLRPDPARHSARIEGMMQRTGDLRSGAHVPADDGPQPIFIVGMPRSGTTLLDRIIGAHSQVTSVGELGDFSRQLRWAADCAGTEYIDERLLDRLGDVDFDEVGKRYLLQTRWRSPTRRYVDKLPVNYQLAGLIARALPHARILHMVRDPMATCFSNYRAFFGAGYGYSYELAALAAQYRDYRRLMRHWHAVHPGRILDVDYDNLTRDPESVLKDVSAFCGLEFEPGCLDLQNNRTPIATLSVVQMDAIRPSEDSAWRRYASELSTLESALAAGTA